MYKLPGGQDSAAAHRLLMLCGTIFLLSQLIGIWAAADRTTAIVRIALVLAATVGVLVLTRNHSLANRYNLVGGLGMTGLAAAFGAAVLAVGFITTSRSLGEIGDHGIRAGQIMSDETVAGALVVLIPIGVGGMAWARGRRRYTSMRMALAALGLAVAGLFWTLERSAGLALCIGFAVALLCHWRFGLAGSFSEFRLVRRFIPGEGVPLAAILLICGLVLFAVLIGRQLLMDLVGLSLYNRLYVWSDVLYMLRDYRFTGIGLGQTAMVLSSYIYLFHVPFLYQVYNLFIQIGLEQGLPGLLGFVGMAVAALWMILRAYPTNRPAIHHHTHLWLCTSTLAALIALLVHGLVEAGLYISPLAPLLLLPVAFAAVLSVTGLQSPAQSPVQLSVYPAARTGVGLSILLSLVVLVAFFLMPGSRAAFWANVGAVEQTRLELGVYAWPEWPVQDELRRSNVVDLSSAETHYRQALQLDPQNHTAHRRLGQIALSRGQYADAHRHLQAAHAAAPRQRMTRLLLGESYAISGNLDRALEVWRIGNTDPYKLELRESWYVHLGIDPEATRMRVAVALFKMYRQQSF